jgi:hypothetical protein
VTVAAGPFAIAALLLVLAGVAKALAPRDTATALRAAGLPAPEALVRAGALAEVGVGVAALVAGDRISAALVAASYAAFTAFVVRALRRDTPLASCGCLGRADTPPTWIHVAIDVAATAAAVAVVADPGAGLPDVLPGQPLAGVPFVLLVACGVALAHAAMSSLPRTLALVREASAGRSAS